VPAKPDKIPAHGKDLRTLTPERCHRQLSTKVAEASTLPSADPDKKPLGDPKFESSLAAEKKKTPSAHEKLAV